MTLDVDVKNAPTLLIKLFEIDTFNFYASQGREIDASVDIDGLVANHDLSRDYTEPAIRRVRRSFSLPQLTKPGVYVVELIGNGMSSRAVIQKGRLQMLARPDAAGHAVTVLDEQGEPVQDARVWLGGRDYEPDETGAITIPYFAKGGRTPVLLRRGDFTTLAWLQKRVESYQLRAGIHVDREKLRAQQRAHVVVRPQLLLSGAPIPVGLLDDPVLTITATDHDGIPSKLEHRGFELFDEAELIHEIEVPERLARLDVTLSGRVRVMSKSTDINITTATRTFEINGIDTTAATGCPLLGRNDAGYVLDVLGKNGEPKVDRPIRIELFHSDFADSITTTLKTDAQGRITLGPLPGITRIKASGMPQGDGSWTLLPDRRTTLPARLHGVEGEVLTLPYPGTATQASSASVSLLEMRGGSFAFDRRDRVQIRQRTLELRNPDRRGLLAVAPGDRHPRRRLHRRRSTTRLLGHRSGPAAGEPQSAHRFTSATSPLTATRSGSWSTTLTRRPGSTSSPPATCRRSTPSPDSAAPL